MASEKSMLRNLFPSRVRSNNGCWTCRLRRKKCDEKRPVCDGCGALEITCYFGNDKPDWMDGGARQREMAERIKSQVKKQASQRRDRKYLEMLEVGTKMVSLEDGDGNGQSRDGQGAATAASAQPTATSPRDALATSDLHTGATQSKNNNNNNNNNNNSTSPFALPAAVTAGHSDTEPSSSGPMTESTPESTNCSSVPSEAPWHSQPFAPFEESEADLDFDIHFVMIYLDYVFPYLFPYYRPPLEVGGRGWILNVVRSSASVYHTAISLASYFFGVNAAGHDGDHTTCMQEMAMKLQVKTELGLRELQKEMCQINARRSEPDMRKAVVTLQSILFMLLVEVATSNKETWKLHLDAATALFQQIIPDPNSWTETLMNLAVSSWPSPESGLKRPWSTAQASIRFFTANLLHIDVMSSIATETMPRLQNYHNDVVPRCREHNPNLELRREGPLDLHEFLGVHNWVLQIMAEVAALAAWKKAQRRNGSLSMTELVCRGGVLLEQINAGMHLLEADLERYTSQASYNDFPSIVQTPRPEPFDAGDIDIHGHPALINHNILWVQATLTHLYLIISGWQPDNPEIQRSAGRIRDMLVAMPKATCLRGQVWPFCVAGCLAPREDEDTFRAMAARMGVLQAFGTMREAMEVLEAVWARREEVDESWDMATCLNILGHGVLLI